MCNTSFMLNYIMVYTFCVVACMTLLPMHISACSTLVQDICKADQSLQFIFSIHNYDIAS